MKIEKDELVCGLKPSVLKNLLKRENFDTPTAMRALGLPEPAATEKLVELERQGFVRWDRVIKGCDLWELGELGQRLVATKLIKRFPVRLGREIVGQVIECAKSLNREPERSARIVAMFLFGSVLTGSDDDLAGDIDLVVVTKARALPENELERLRKIERGNTRLGPFGYWFAGQSALRKSIRAVSQKISLHDESELELLGIPYRQIYAFDVASEREAPFDPAIRTPEKRHLPSVHPRRPEQSPRAWPDPPKRMPFVSLDERSACEVQNRWVNGLSIEAIAKLEHLKPAEVRGYLSGMGQARPWLVDRTYTSLRASMGEVLPAGIGHTLLVTIRMGKPHFDRVEIELFDSPQLCASWGSVLWFSGRDGAYYRNVKADLAPGLPPLLAVARQWRKRHEATLGALSCTVGAFFDPEDSPVDAPRTSDRLDFSGFQEPMLAALHRFWTAPRDEERADRHRMVATLSSWRPEFHYVIGHPHYGSEQRHKLRKAERRDLEAAYESFRARWSNKLEDHWHFSLEVSGDALLPPENE